jgi:small-conductance mechanosensitive channel
MIENLLSWEWLTHHRPQLLRAILLLFVAWPLLRILAGTARRVLRKKASEQAGMLAYMVLFYLGSAIIVLTVLFEFGFKLTTLLGAAGIAGVAIGFASQTSLSNIISGVFLVWEEPFQIGDVLQVGSTSGVVQSIELLSTKLRTFDNKYVRIPNETLIKSEVTNITRFPVRRLDINLGVAYKEDIGRVIKILKEIADLNPNCLDEPEPIILFRGFGESSLDFLFGVWFAKEDFIQLRNSIYREIKERFDQEGIEIPFPHRTIYTGSATHPFPVTVLPPETSPGSSN